MKQARTCYDHLAGRLGVRLTEALVEAGVIEPGPGLGLTRVGVAWLADNLALDVAPLLASRRPVTRSCLDWTERRPHLAGALGAALCTHFFTQSWITRAPVSRTPGTPASASRAPAPCAPASCAPASCAPASCAPASRTTASRTPGTQASASCAPGTPNPASRSPGSRAVEVTSAGTEALRQFWNINLDIAP